jgi:hypothetical protein
MTNLRQRFPDLCNAIIARRAKCRAEHKRSLKINLEAILLEEPPPTMKDVAKRLGYKSSSLRYDYAKLSRAISTRHADYCKAQLQDIRFKLEATLHEEVPPSLVAAARRFERTSGYLSMRFPEVCRAISRRYLQFKESRALERKNNATTRIRLLALDLHAKKRYPSVKRIKETLDGPYVLSPTELNSLMIEIRRELGLKRPSFF